MSVSEVFLKKKGWGRDQGEVRGWMERRGKCINSGEGKSSLGFHNREYEIFFVFCAAVLFSLALSCFPLISYVDFIGKLNNVIHHHHFQPKKMPNTKIIHKSKSPSSSTQPNTTMPQKKFASPTPPFSLVLHSFIFYQIIFFL